MRPRGPMSTRLYIDPGQTDLTPMQPPVTDDGGKDPLVLRRLADIRLSFAPEHSPYRIRIRRRDHSIKEAAGRHAVDRTRSLCITAVLIAFTYRSIRRKRWERLRAQPGFGRRIRDACIDQSDRDMIVTI